MENRNREQIISSTKIKDNIIDSTFPPYSPKGTFDVEKGEFKKKRTSIISRIKSKVVLHTQRYSIFSSPEFRKRTRENTGECHSSYSTVDLLHSVINPAFQRKANNQHQRTEIKSSNDEDNEVPLDMIKEKRYKYRGKSSSRRHLAYSSVPRRSPRLINQNKKINKP
jgi:hypothetical protein